MSDGIRSGVNWMRLKETSRIWLMELTMSVLARPGTPSEEAVAAREDGGQHLIDDLALADDDAAELGHHLAARLAEVGQVLADAVGGHRDGSSSGGAAGAACIVRRGRTAEQSPFQQAQGPRWRGSLATVYCLVRRRHTHAEGVPVDKGLAGVDYYLMARPRHPCKEIEAAVQYAESRGWTCTPAPGHAWGRLRCPRGQRDGCQLSVYSTPRNPQGHADLIRRRVDRCRH